MDKEGIQTNGPKNKEIDDDVSGTTGWERWSENCERD